MRNRNDQRCPGEFDDADFVLKSNGEAFHLIHLWEAFKIKDHSHWWSKHAAYDVVVHWRECGIVRVSLLLLLLKLLRTCNTPLRPGIGLLLF